jgi:hypothetical protein
MRVVVEVARLQMLLALVVLEVVETVFLAQQLRAVLVRLTQVEAVVALLTEQLLQAVPVAPA